jgi:hypothetical protein
MTGACPLTQFASSNLLTPLTCLLQIGLPIPRT